MKHLRSINYIFLIIGVFILNIPFVVAKEDFEIKSVSVSEKSSTITVDDLVFEDNTISSNISFNQLNDFVTFDIEVENNTNIDYVLEKINNNINSNYLTIESEDTGKTISNNTTQTIKVKIKYDKELVNHDDINLNNVSLGLVFKNPKTLINPLTGKNIFIFITIVIISILSFYALKNKKSKSLLLLLLLLIPTLVYAAESNNVELKFDNITIKGRYLQYRVTINNGTESQEVIRTYGETIGELPEITPKEGYTIDGWVNQEEEKVDESTVVTDTIQVAPKYNPIEYTITYNLNDGTLENENPEKYTIEDEITLNNPSIPGYTFAGWVEGTSGILQTNVTINKGTMGDKVFTAFYSTNQDTKYTVIHRQMNLDGEFVEFEREELHGATDTNVTPQVKQYEGFTSPEELQTKNIDGDGETVFIYDYVRNTYEFNITDRSYITINSTPNGSYYYGTNITIAAVERVGYTFSWSDGDTNLTRAFELKSNKTLTPVYTPNTNTPYKVVHKTMNLDGTTYSTKDEISYFGTTGEEVEPNTNIYEGFTAPEKQRVRIDGNGSTVIEYLYTRNKYHLTIEDSEYVETTTPSNDYYYGTSITLKAKSRNKYTFVKWSNDNTNSQITFELKRDTVIGPIYSENNHVITFNYNGGEGNEPTRNIEPGHEIGTLPTATRTGYYLDGWYLNITNGEKLTSSFVPTGNTEIFAKWKKSVASIEFADNSIILDEGEEKNIVITNTAEIEETYTYSSNNESIATVDSTGKVTGISVGNTTITITGTKSEQTKTITVVVLSNQYVVTFNGNGGTPETQTVPVTKGLTIATLPTATKEKHFLEGWFTSIPDGIKIENGYRPEQNITLYAKWKKAITNANVENTNIEVEKDGTATINITNPSEIEETYTYLSNDESIATVDENGTITGIAPGTTTIIITGTESHETITITVTVTAPVIVEYTVTFNYNGTTGTETSRLVESGHEIGNLPVATRTGYYLDGWYIDLTNGEKITSNYIVNSNVEIIARWKKSVESMEFVDTNIILDVAEEKNIVITNAETIEEEYTYNSNNESIATVDQNGKITGIAIGETTITITGTKSNKSKTINVVVLSNQYVVTFNGNGGTPESQFVEVLKGETIATLPTVIRQNYYFDGWYTSIPGGTKVEDGYRPEQNITLQAKWIKSVDAMEFDETSITLHEEAEQIIVITNSSEIEEPYTFTSNDESIATVDSTGKVTGVSVGNTTITITGTKSNQTKTISVTVTAIEYEVTFNGNGGTPNSQVVQVTRGETIATLPTVVREQHYFDGWYTNIPNGVKVEDGYRPEQSITLYAKWKKAITYGLIENDIIDVDIADDTEIVITNSSEIEETYTYTSSNPAVATVDSTGTVTGISVGTTTITITGDESHQSLTVIVRVNDPNQVSYTVHYDANGGTGSMEDQTILRNTPTNLSNNTFIRLNYNFTGWNTASDGTGTSYANGQQVTNIANTSITLYAQWTIAQFPYVFKQDGACTFNGSDSNITGEECTNYTNQKYIDTGISLYSSENINKDYEIGFTIDEYGSDQVERATLMNTKAEKTGYPGLVFRRNNATSDFLLQSRRTSSANSEVTWPTSSVTDVIVYRIEGQIYYSINGSEKTFLNDLTEYNPTFDLTAWFGASPANSSGTTAQRYFKGTLSNMYIKLGNYEDNNNIKVKFDVNGGDSLSPSYKYVQIGEQIGELPIPTRNGYYFNGWYNSLESIGEEIHENYIPTNSLTLYARWNKSVASMNITNDQIVMRTIEEADINISNAQEIDEEWTYTSANPEVATVSPNGHITAVGVGETEINITGTTSNQTKYVYVNIYPEYTVTYDAQVGNYQNNENTNEVTYGLASKNSRTANVAADGQLNTTYGNNWNESNIVGSSRGEISNAHVIKFPDADKIRLDIYYGSYSSSNEYATVWQGNYPEYTSSANYSSGISGFTRLGGTSSSTQIINGNSIQNIYYKKTDITGNTITIGFTSQSNSSSSNKYGYYAIAKWLNTIEGTYEEPTKDNARFMGWYKNAECTEGQEFDPYNITEDTTVYAKYGYTITFSANGGSTPSPSSKDIVYQGTIGTLPTTTKTGYYLDGWYTSLDASGEKVTTDYVPSGSITLYAKWKKSVASITTDPETITTGRTMEESINITNTSEIEEEYTFESSNPSIATVDQTGTVTGVSSGTTTIIIRGLTSNQTKEITVNVSSYNVITYNANGGKFSDDSSIKKVIAKHEVRKYSHTENVDDTGYKLSNYGHNWTNSNIRGTDRTSASSNAHVVTIPGATTLTVDVYYNGEGTSCDWVSVWSGSHPTYTAANNYSSAISYPTKLGGSQAGTYTVNGNYLTNMGHVTLTISGDTVTFGFKSDGSVVGQGYGYYAIIKADINTECEEPTKENMSFSGWYKDAACTDGQEYNDTQQTTDLTVYAKWTTNITFDVNGGSAVTPNVRSVVYNRPIGTLPTTTRSGYYLDGWYTSLDSSGEKIDENYIVSSAMTLYAKWKKSVESMTIDNENITLTKPEEEQIAISNASEIEEEYTFESSDTSIATVDATGTIRGISSGTATITIRGSKSNHTKTVTVTVTNLFDVTFEANGGTFTNNQTTITSRVADNTTTKYSHTSNIDDTGKKNSNYGANWTNANITGTDRGDTSQAHVVTIPDAPELIVDIYYNGESTTYDWVSVWEGSHPDYTASSNYSSAITKGQKLGGYQYDQYTVNGNSLTSMGHVTLTIPGDTVTFGFKSNGSGYGYGYGYYAIITGKSITSYEEPTRDDFSFIGWYRDSEGTPGQEISIYQIDDDMTLYAKWGYIVTFDVNGGNTLESNKKKLSIGDSIGELPTPTRGAYYLDGWYTSLDTTGEKVDEEFIPSGSVTLYAKWKKSVGSMVLSSSLLSVDRGVPKAISISNASSIEEEYTFESRDPSIATVDANGRVTGIAAGTTTITIRGVISGHTKTVTVTVTANNSLLVYEANGGVFSDNTTTNVVSFKPETQYSHTENIDDTGKKNSNYGNNWDNYNIRGTGRTSGSSNAHVLSFSGGSSLNLTIYYSGESTTYDWVTVWQGNNPSYNAVNNYSSGISGYTKLGGSCSSSYTVNGNTLSNVCRKSTTIYSSYVTFGFESNGSGYGSGFGYYAIVTGTSKTGTTKTPTRENASFLGWYKDQECSNGQEFNATTVSTDTTVYARWGNTITYNVNGGKSLSSTTKKVSLNEPVGTLATTTKEGYYLDGWYTTADNTGIRITEDYVPTTNMTIYAHWKKSVASLNVEPTLITIGKEEEEQITISNTNGIEEEYTIETSDTSIVTVDQTGKVTAVAPGLANIIIRGSTSNQEIIIPVWILDSSSLTFDANGGTFANNRTVITSLTTDFTEKYSHTENVNDSGYKSSNYGNNWTNSNIRGTGRTSASSDAHVITISSSDNLIVDVYYNGESTSWDWVSIWQGSHSNYTASGYYSSAISNAQKLGGVQSGTYTVKGNSLINMGHSTLLVPGNTVTFGFKSDSSGVGQGYGYYAIVRGLTKKTSFETPTRENATFLGWYANAEGTGEAINPSQLENNTVLYAKWGYQINYNANGGSSISPNTIIIDSGEPIGELPTTTKAGYYFDGWYTSTDASGTKITEDYVPTTNLTLYAHWKKSVASLGVSQSSISIPRTYEYQITISNASSIDEEYVIESSNEEIVIVDQTFKVTGVSPGDATINIRGLTSNQVKSIQVHVSDNNIITYDANGGTFSNDRTTITSVSGIEKTKYSHTQNIDDTGLKNSNYENNWTSANITGTDRGDTTKNHVVTILDAQQLIVDIYYNGETCCDYLYLWQGSNPDGNNEFTPRIAYFYLGSYSNTYTVNGNTLSNVGHSQYTVEGDTVTFGFRSDSSNVGQGYGYYAIVTGIGMPTVEEPTKENMTFGGWYTDPDCTAGNEFDSDEIDSDITVYAKWGYLLAYNANGGSDITPDYKVLAVDEPIGTFPTTTKSGYYIEGWYTALDSSGEKINEEYVPNSIMTIYPHWRKSVESMTFDETSISIGKTMERQIDITNASEIEEEWTYTSSDPTIATVDENGFVTGVSPGDATITITGVKSGTTKTISVNVINRNVITYDANGGTFTNNRTTNKAFQGNSLVKVSHTDNVSDLGKKNNAYGNNMSNANIRGTGRTEASSEAHVVIIPSASKLAIELYYGTPSQSYDWLSVWEGSHPEYNATDNYSSAISGSQRIGGYCNGYTYTVNGNSLSYVCKRNIEVEGDTVTFGFKSSYSSTSYRYGYYAIVKEVASSNNYEEPTNGNKELIGWYNDAECTAGQEYDDNEITTDKTVYAKWGYKVTYNVNGGSSIPNDTRMVGETETIGAFPTTTLTNYYLDGWYTSTDSTGIKVDENYIPTANITLYARWKYSVEYMTISNPSISVGLGLEDQINITNKSSIQEDYTFTSSDSTIATVDQNGIIRGISPGRITVTIRGSRSNKVREISVYVLDRSIITYDANGGTFTNNRTTIDAVQGSTIEKYSYTENINSIGYKSNNYGTNWSNANIRGTERTEASSEAHVVTIPGAEQLTVDLYYGTYNSTTDWVSVWSGSHPEYNAVDNYSSAIENAQKIGSYCANYTYTVNGISLSRVCKMTITVEGDTVTFGYTSSSTESSSYKYGYYAVVKDKNMQHTYEEPTKSYASFLGWYKNPECSDGQEYDDSETTESMTVYAKWGIKVTYNVNNGITFYPNIIKLDIGEPLGELVTPKRTGYYFDGWYTSTNADGIQVDENYIPNASMTIYARWKRSVASIETDSTTIYVGRNISQQINITNASLIEEEWTYSSSDTSIATVDENGVVTGVSSGNVKIYITGNTSHQVKEVPIVVLDKNTITYDANGGTFSDNRTTNMAVQGASVVKYSHTQNIDDTGKKYGDYGDNWTNANITGTDRGDTSQAHVVTIPGAQNLSVVVYYSTEYSGYDWASIWQGNYPTYTASDNYSYSLSNRLGGYCTTNTYTVNGITLTNVCRNTYTVNGDTVTFGFRTNESEHGYGYGYYAIVKEKNIPYTYEEPTRENMKLLGWYKDAACTDGQEYDDTTQTTDLTVYAKWGHQVQFDVNGGNPIGETSRVVSANMAIGTLPTPTKTGYLFDGWYTSLTGNGIKIDNNYIPTSNMTVYAKWKTSVLAMNINPRIISIERGIKEKINITNISEIEEEFTFESSDTSIATVNQTGNVTGIAPGETSIIIRGVSSHETITIPVKVSGNILITYNANGGVFSNSDTINTTSANNNTQDTIKYSHTSNIDDTGKQNSNYATYAANSYIVGTDRGDTSKAHVVTIPGTNQLIVEIYYNGQTSAGDWVSVWEGSHPDYTAYNNYSTAITDAKRLGGPQSGTYEVNGNTLTNMGHKTLYVDGDTVTFSFRSDSSGSGYGYGYYAIVKAATKQGRYEEPTRENYKFNGWYKNAECTAGQEFDRESNVTADTTVYAKWDYNFIFDVNGGDTLETSEKHISPGNQIGELPIPTKTGYYFTGWYTSLDTSGIRIEETTIPSSGMTLYAKWRKSVVSMDLNPEAISVEIGHEETINILNTSAIEEEWTYTSNDDSIATVDSTGKVTGISEGITSITITGLTSNQTKNIEVYVMEGYKLTYNANGGQFSNNETTKQLVYLGSGVTTKYSHTQNIDDTGRKLSNYQDYWTNANITGTDRGDTSKAHVVTIPGATTLTVDIYYNGESTSWDWVSVWSGSHPTYTASDNYSSAISNAQKLGGSQSGTYTVNDNTLTNMGHIQLTVEGNTVTFGFRSDSSGVGQGYGYYAIIKGDNRKGTYEEPTRDGYTFYNWYNDAECTDGQEFNANELNGNTTVYAAWAYNITYDVNGGVVLSPSNKLVKIGNAAGSLAIPSTNNTGYYFEGWYTSLDTSGVKITEDYVPTSNMTVYAKWKKSVWNVVQDPPTVTLIPGEEQTITVTNPQDIEEEYTFESSDESIATVDQTGKVTGVATGSTTIVIRGVRSNQTKSIPVTVDPTYTVTYDASGGSFKSGESTNEVQYGKNVIKYSYTENLDSTGRKISDYGNNWNNSNIKGTDRGDTSKAHVVTIPNAKNLTIDLYYNTQNSSYDWLSVWQGSHPEYTAYRDYSYSYLGYRYGGTSTNSNTINGNTLSNVYKYTITIPGDTATFGFYSDGSGIGGGYGYYAVIKGKQNVGAYEEPTKPGLKFYGWYNDAACTAGQEYNDGQLTETATVYAGYAYTIRYDVNGGATLSNHTQYIKQEREIGTLPTTTRTGYYLDGWYTEKVGGEKVTTSYIPTDNMKLYAHWKKSVASMKFDNDSISMEYGKNANINILNPSEIEEEWTYTSNNTSIATVDETGKVTGVSLGTTSITIRGTTSNQTKTINVSVIHNNYDIVLDSNGGDIHTTINYVSIDPLGKLPVPKNNNYIFLGWYTSLDVDGIRVEENYYPTNDMTLYARWSTQKEYIISFDSNGGSPIEDLVIPENQAITELPIPIKNQYHLDGWYTSLESGIKIETPYYPTDSIKLYAKWVAASTYTITFDANEGSTSEETRSVYSDTPIGDLPVATRTNYSFIGWLDENTNTYYSPNTIPTGNVTLKAQWNTTNYVARINDNYYSSISNAISNANENDTIVLIKNTSETVTNNKKVTLNLNGYKLTGSVTNNTDGDLTIINGTIEGSNSTTTLITNSGKVTLGTDKYLQNDKVILTLSKTTSSSIYGINGGTVTMNNADLSVIAKSGSSAAAYGIYSNDITINDGTVNVENNTANSYLALGILFTGTDPKLELNNGNIMVYSIGGNPIGIRSNVNNANITINGGKITAVDNASSGTLARGIDITYSNTKITMNGGEINATSTNFRSIAIYNEACSYLTTIIHGGKITYGGGTAQNGGVFIATYGTYSNVIITGGKFDANYYYNSTYSRGFSMSQSSSNLFIYGGEIKLQPATTGTIVYGAYNSDAKVYYHGGTFKMKGTTLNLVSNTSKLYLPSGKKVVSSIDSDGYTVYSLGNS